MTGKALIVVSDQFSSFTKGKQAVTESQLRAMRWEIGRRSQFMPIS